MDQLFMATNSTDLVHHIASGSFRSLSLFLLAFSPLHRTLSLVDSVPAFGPHQYLATNPRKDRVYTTSWALPPVLSSWSVHKSDFKWNLEHVNNVPITATSSYISLPPPYTHLYSAGGPTGEVHTVDKTTGGFGSKIQQVLFVTEDQLEAADKTRIALRYGSHAVEISPQGYAFIPVLGTNSIELYLLDRQSGKLQHLSSNPSGQPGDGPRHIVVSNDGNKVYSVGEHSNTLDIFKLDTASDAIPKLIHVASRSLLPPSVRTDQAHNPLYRGDTLRFFPSTSQYPVPRHIVATTRGAKSGIRGWLTVFELDSDGLFVNGGLSVNSDSQNGFETGADRYETATSGGKANAIDILAKQSLDEQEQGVWILLTDDDEDTFGVNSTGSGLGAVRVLEWNEQGAGGVHEVVAWPLTSEERDAALLTRSGEKMNGASHAIWLD